TFTLVLSHDVRSVTPTFVSTPSPPTPAPSPTRTPIPSALAIRPCRAEDLVVQADGNQGAGGNIVVAFLVSNISADTCRVHGAPVPETRDAEGVVLRQGVACASLSAA